MKFVKVISAHKTQYPDMLDLMVEVEDNERTIEIPYGWRVGDTFGIGPDVDAWMQEHKSFPVKAYKPPVATIEDIRTERDRLIATTDWTQLADVAAETRDKWAGYRQQLRDFPDTVDLENVVWPSPPQP